MLSISGITNGIVLDHIHAGRAAVVYHMLHLERLDCPIAIIYNARSSKMGKKDIIKLETSEDVLNIDALAFIDDGITIDYIRNCQMPEPAVHHHHRAGPARRIRADRPGQTDLPMRVLRAEVSQEF